MPTKSLNDVIYEAAVEYLENGGGGGGGDATADNQIITNTALGTPTDVASTAGGTGSITSQLRRTTTELDRIGDTLDSMVSDTSSSSVKGSAANDAALTEAPVPIGGLAKNSNPTKVADGDAVYTRHDLTGRPVMVPHQQRDLHGDETSTFTATTSAATIVSAGGANVYRDLISLTISNSSATATLIEVYNDDGTTVRWRGYAPAGQMTGIVFPVPLKQAATNVTWKAKTTTSVSSVYITAQYLTNV